MTRWVGGRRMSSAASTRRSRCCCGEPLPMRAGCPSMLPRCRAEVGHWPPIANTRGWRWIHEVNDHRSSDDTRSRGTGRVYRGAAQSARRAGTMGTVNAAAVVTVQHLVKRYGPLIAVNDVSLSIHEGEIFGI